ncbi:ATP-binding protein [Lentzea albida]|uniref:Anti-sigma regulatory factor (Ser/Thr protein kinase) n=1 Tax=Lentzea albida TaxID=65499 RepID=A0A1H9WF38_9PSEU|nr:ATP-binding protein [Lentzea albida]SES32399.1 Anti-sigma regulatory factor (Ser/Thr protein kinase) [Lentzea albida]
MAGSRVEQLKVRAEERDECTLISVDGVLGRSTYAVLRDYMLKCAVEAPRALVVDLSNVTIATTSALSVFTTVWLRISDWPATPLLVATGSRHVELLRRTAIRRYVGVYGQVGEALANVERPAPRKRVARELPHDPSSPRAARLFVRQTCAEWELADLLTNDAVQVASELVQNTVQHTFSEVVRLRLELRRGRLTVAVGDDSSIPVVLGDPGSPANFGRGLHVVAQLARTWGCVIDRPGGRKTVWAVL